MIILVCILFVMKFTSISIAEGQIQSSQQTNQEKDENISSDFTKNVEFSQSYQLYRVLEIARLCNELFQYGLTYSNVKMPNIKFSIKTGKRIGLVCPYCTEINEKSFFFWYRAGRRGTKTYERITTTNSSSRVFLKRNILFIESFHPVLDSGMYFCISDQMIPQNAITKYSIDFIESRIVDMLWNDFRGAPYFVESSLFVNFYLSGPETRERTDELAYLIKPDEAENITRETYRVYNEWGEWTTCEKCGQDSVRLRRGECKFSFGLEADPIVDGKLWAVYKKYLSEQPCHLMSNFKRIDVNFTDAVRIFRQVYQIEYCYVDCKSFDKVKYKEQTKDFMINQPAPNDSDDVDSRKKIPSNSIKRSRGEHVRLLCANQKFVRYDQLEWKKNGFPLFNRRVRFRNVLNELEIVRLDYIDSGTYECNVNGRIVVRIELTVVLRTRQIDQDEYNRRYDFIERSLTETFFIISTVVMIAIICRYIREAFLKNSKEKVKSIDKNLRLKNMHYYLKINVESFEKILFEYIIKDEE